MRRIVLGIVLFAVLELPGLAQQEQPPAREISPIVVTPSAYLFSAEGPSARRVDLRDAMLLPLIDNDLLRTAHLYPGVVANDFSARFQLRGGEKDEVLLRLDGVPLYQPFHLPDFDGAISAIDPMLVGRAELHMGGFPPRLGDRMSGVFDLESRRPAEQRRTLLSLDLLKLQLLQEGPLAGGGYLFSVRRGYIDWILELIDQIQPLDEKFRPRYLDLFGKYALQGPGGGRLEWGALYSRDTNLMDRPGGLEDLNSTYDSGVGWIRWELPLGAEHLLILRPYGGQASRDRLEGTLEEPVERDKRKIAYFGLIGELLLVPHPAHRVSLGLESLWSRGEYRYLEQLTPFPELIPDPPTIDVDAKLSGWQWSGFLEDEWQVGRSVAVLGGVRWLRQVGESRVWWSPRLGLAIRPVPMLTLRVAGGRYLQPIGPMELPVESGVTTARPPERADHLVVGLEWSPDDRLVVRLEGYRKRYRNLTGRSRDVGRQTQFARFPTQGEAWGAELFVQQRLSDRLSWTGGYAYSKVEVTEAGQTYPRDFDQRHTILFSLIARLSERTSLTISWRGHSGNPVTPVRFEAQEDGSLKPVLGPPNSERLPPFHSLDLRLSRTYRPRWGSLTAYFQVVNLYNRKNVHEYSYDPEQGYARVEEPLLPITPTFGLTGSF
ncbi:MAG: TonB-dependent receptor [Candidatus Poribacteria bacterium]|nr:MAG: TonB-dependent receptor [Candidatus Poribacteria bacterium]